MWPIPIFSYATWALAMNLQCSQEKALILLKAELPEYLQNILLACGYDKLETLVKLELPSDIDEMLTYIKESFTDYSMQICSNIII